MFKIITLVIATALVGCSISPPKPPAFKGEYKPINKPVMNKDVKGAFNVFKTFDFTYEGDIAESLNALKKANPDLVVLAPLGKKTPLLVRINLSTTTTEDALRAIGSQGGTTADVVYNTSPINNVKQAFIRYHN